MNNDKQQVELDELLKETENIASYLSRQISNKTIHTQLDIQNIKRFMDALENYKRVTK
jgi:hypothetical protein